MLSCLVMFATPWTAACQAPLSMVILQARILEWVAMSSFRGSSQPRVQTQFSCIAGRFFTVWASREDYWTGLPCLSPGYLPNPGIKPRSAALWLDSLPSEPPGKPWILEQIPLIQSKEQRLCFAGAAMKRYTQGKRNPSKMVGVARGHQRADRVKPQSQKTNQSNHMDHSLV